MQKRSSSLVRNLMFSVAIVFGCSGRTQVGSESNFAAPCQTDSDCASGHCVAKRCAKSSSGGASSRDASSRDASSEDASSGGTSSGARAAGGASGGSGNDGGAGGTASPAVVGGCSTGGLYTPPEIGTGGLGTGGAPATCPVDSEGIATLDQGTFCSQYRCPSAAGDLLTGLSCTAAATNGTGITLTSGCGTQTVTLPDYGFSYVASFDAEGGFIYGEVREKTAFGQCSALGYRTGAPSADCATSVTYQCEHTTPQTGPYAGCREPGATGCSTCCAPVPGGQYCNAAFTWDQAPEYDGFDSLAGACPCNCPACATCTTDIEMQVRTFPEMAGCDCPPPPPSNSGGTGGTGSGGEAGCDAYCPAKNQLITECPGLR